MVCQSPDPYNDFTMEVQDKDTEVTYEIPVVRDRLTHVVLMKRKAGDFRHINQQLGIIRKKNSVHRDELYKAELIKKFLFSTQESQKLDCPF